MSIRGTSVYSHLVTLYDILSLIVGIIFAEALLQVNYSPNGQANIGTFTIQTFLGPVTLHHIYYGAFGLLIAFALLAFFPRNRLFRNFGWFALGFGAWFSADDILQHLFFSSQI